MPWFLVNEALATLVGKLEYRKKPGTLKYNPVSFGMTKEVEDIMSVHSEHKISLSLSLTKAATKRAVVLTHSRSGPATS